jgi:ABC-type multidrug transport system permease subunit
MSSRRALVELTKWRLREFIREPEAIFWIFAFPLLLAMALGIAFQNRGEPTAYVIVEDGAGAEELHASLDEAPNLDVSMGSPDEARNALRTGQVELVVVPGDPITFRYDSTREQSLLARLVTDDALQRAAGRDDVREVREERGAEPGARYIDFLLPGLLGMNIMGTGIWGVGWNIAVTRQRKLLKRFVASPMRRGHYLLAQMLARMVFLVLEVGALLLFGYWAFGVPFRGSFLTFSLIVFAGALTFAGIGVLIASRVKTIEGVSGLMNVVMMPMWILSGVFFSASHFPDVMQPVIKALPLTALIDAIRAVMLEGVPFVSTLGWMAVIVVWGVGSFGVALKIFRWS